MLDPTPYCDQVYQLAHYYSISYHQSSVKGGVTRNLLQPVGPPCDLLHDGVMVPL